MKNKLIWAALFGLLITLVTGAVKVTENPIYAPLSDATFTYSTAGFGFPALYIEEHYIFHISPRNTIVTIFYSNGTNDTLVNPPDLPLEQKGKLITHFEVKATGGVVGDYPDFTVQLFQPIGFVFNWLFFSFVMLLLVGGWQDLKRVFDSVDSKNVVSRLLFILAVASFFFMFFSSSWWLPLYYGVAFLLYSMFAKYSANKQVQEETP